MKSRYAYFALLVLALNSKALAQTQPTVLVEGFTNIDCTNCPVPDGALDSYDSTHADVVTVWVHPDFPNPKDPFFLASKNSANARFNTSSSFWNGTSEPQAYMNGSDAGGGNGGWTEWKPTLQAIEKSPGLTATIAITRSPRQDSIQLLIHCSGNVPSQVNLNVFLVESGIYYDNSGTSGHGYGNPPGDIWNNILRRTLPTPNGTPGFTLNGTADFAITVDTTGTGWKLGNMKAVAFLQDVPQSVPTGSANVEGLAVFNFASLGVEAKSAITRPMLGNASPNPFSAHTTLQLSLDRAANVRIVLIDDLGREVSNPVDRFLSSGVSAVTLDAATLPPGLYQARMYVDGAFAGSAKVMNVR